MQLSYSRVSLYKKCPYQFKLRYIDKLETLPTYDPQDPLVLGTALHKGIEEDVKTAIDGYYASYPVITDLHVNEAIKLEYWLPKIKQLLPDGQHEVLIEDEDFKGFIDLLVPVGYMSKDHLQNQYGEDVDLYDIYDFKYSNNVKNYIDSEQLHLYKYYFEKLNPGKKIRNMYYMFVPKTGIRIKYKNKTNPRDETIAEFRKRIISTLDKNEIQFIQINYDPRKVIEFLIDAKHAIEDTEYKHNETRLCDWCAFKSYCQKEEDFMILPKNERITQEGITKKKIWIYGMPFSGKTFLANEFPDILLLSTDGNYTQLPGGIPPHIDIKNIVTTEGRITKTQLAWDVFKEAISELEKKQNDFKTVVVDLVEDTYEACRLYMYDQLGITHESDDSFRAWDKVRTEFLSTMKRLMALDYENIILISHEDTSKDITKKSGDKVTSIKPNINDKCANKLAGMVDLVVRTIADGDNYQLSFKKNEVVFGGGRLNTHVDEIKNNYDELMDVYDAANATTTATTTTTKKETPKRARKKVETAEETLEKLQEEALGEEIEKQLTEEKPKKRTRKARKTEEVEEETDGPNWVPGGGPDEHELVEPVKVEDEVEEKPKKRVRKTRKVEEEPAEEEEEAKPRRRRRRAE